MKRIFLLAAGGLCGLFLLVAGKEALFGDPQIQVERQFVQDLPQLTKSAQAILSGEEMSPPEGWEAGAFEGTVCFDYGGRGIGSATSYWGVCYVPEDEPVGFQGLSMEEAVLQGDGWLWEEQDGDNRCYVQRLAPCWYYFKMDF